MDRGWTRQDQVDVKRRAGPSQKIRSWEKDVLEDRKRENGRWKMEDGDGDGDGRWEMGDSESKGSPDLDISSFSAITTARVLSV